MTAASEAPVGLMGGTFDPVHYGHLRAAVEVHEKLGLAEVRMMVSAQPPHRQPPAASAEHRLAMLERATARHDFLVADDLELRRDGPSYMVDTLRELRRQAGDSPLVLLIGQDAANGLDRWHDWRRLFELAHIAVMRRPEAVSDYRGVLKGIMRQRRVDDPSVLRETPAGKVLPVETTQLEISSTSIRAIVAAGRSPHYLTPPPVIDYIREHGLYA